MVIRVLCLHGMGDNAAILEHQTREFHSMLPSTYEFIFADGPQPCAPSPGALFLTDGVDGKCWWNTPTNTRLADAHSYISDLMKRIGGVDVVLGFSQGAATLASMLLMDQIERPDAPPFCRAAMFICSPLAFSTDRNHGIDVRQYFGINASISCGRPTYVPDHLVASQYFRQNEYDLGEASDSDSSYTNASDSNASDSDSENESTHTFRSKAAQAISGVGQGPYYNMFHPDVDKFRINIPTAHVYGARDEWKSHSMELLGLCASQTSTFFEHDGGHEIPRDQSEELCDIFENLIASAGLA